MYYFSEINIRGNHAGTKARNDVETILKNSGAIPINKKPLILKSDINENIYSNIRNRFDFLDYFVKANILKNEVIFIQYPMLSFDKDKKYVKTLSKKNHVVLLIHDIHSLRRGNYEELKKEIDFLNLADILIVHNNFMKKELENYGVNVKKIYNLGIFDYLFTPNDNDLDIEVADIVFAGNLEKSVFLDDFILSNVNIKMNLYGIGWKEKWNQYKNINYIGNFTPDEIPSKLKGKYGLVWDGDSINTCSGFLGEYTKINNPHKFSLYIAAGIPVIAWKESAIAEYIKKYDLGIVLDSLSNLKVLLDEITEEEYLIKCENIKKIRNRVINGKNLKEIIQMINNREEDVYE